MLWVSYLNQDLVRIMLWVAVMLVVLCGAAGGEEEAGWRYKPWLTEVEELGGNATLRCLIVEQLGGATNVSRFWWSSPQGEEMSGRGSVEGSETSFLVNNTGHLTLNNIEEAMLGWYTCRAILLDNGTGVSKAWLLKVKSDQELREELNKKLVIGSIAAGSLFGSITLICLVYKFRWQPPKHADSPGVVRRGEDGVLRKGEDGVVRRGDRGMGDKDDDMRMSTSRLEMIVSPDYQTDTVSSSGRGDDKKQPSARTSPDLRDGHTQAGAQAEEQDRGHTTWGESNVGYEEERDHGTRYVTRIESDGEEATVKENHMTTQL